MKTRKIIALLLIAAMMVFSVGCVKQAIGALLGYIVKFDPNGGTVVSGELKQKIKPGLSAEPPVLTRQGYEFAGYDGDYTDIQESKTLTARWLKLYTISFDPAGGELNGEFTQIVAEGKLPSIPDVERFGWIFEGWDKDVKAASSDARYTAQWTRRIFTATEVSETISPAVIEITTQDFSGDDYSLGSGFFIDDQGTAVTNFHVMEGAYSATAAMSDGTEHDIVGVVSYDKDLDLAIIKVDISDNPYLRISEDEVETGQTVYAIGSSLGLTGTFSNGIVSTASREVLGIDCIQVTAPISRGNSGGPLVNEYCEVIGINSMTLTEGQNLNFAINVKELDKLPEDSYLDIADFGAETVPPPGYYGVYSEHEHEPNDTNSLAYELTPNADPVAGDIGDMNDEDCYRIHVDYDCTARIYISIYGDDDAVSYKFGYYTGSTFNRISLSFTYDSANNRHYATYDLDSDLTYYIYICSPNYAALYSYPIYYAVWVEGRA